MEAESLSRPISSRNAYSPSIFFWLVISALLLSYHWHQIAVLDLGDNDNYMRLLQFLSFAEHGNWYVTPMERFNFQDGLIIHWSRLPDIPLAFSYRLFSLFIPQATALTLTLALVPVLYLLILILVLSILTRKCFGEESSVIAALYISFSLMLFKFSPGSIDHHNVQMLLFALFLLHAIQQVDQPFSRRSAWLSGALIALSLLIGLEGLPFFVLVLTLFVLLYPLAPERWLSYATLTSLSCAVFSSLGMLLLLPWHSLAERHNDALSYPLIILFLLAALIGRLMLHKPGYIKLFFLSFLFFGLFIYRFPDVFNGPYYHYPDILKHYWLNNVSEAIPIWKVIENRGWSDRLCCVIRS